MDKIETRHSYMTYQSTVKIFIDDIRLPPEEYDVCFKKISDFSEYLENITSITIIDKISLDYDFDYTDITQTGYDGLVLLIDKIKKTDLISVNEIQFHTSNNEGWKSMYELVLINLTLFNKVVDTPILIEDGVETKCCWRFL